MKVEILLLGIANLTIKKAENSRFPRFVEKGNRFPKEILVRRGQKKSAFESMR